MNSRNPMAVAEDKGRKAAREGLSENDCPYKDKRKYDGRLTFSRAWRNAWLIGFRNEQQGIKGSL